MVNQVPLVAQGLQQARRLDWHQQEAQIAPDPMEPLHCEKMKLKAKVQKNKQDGN